MVPPGPHIGPTVNSDPLCTDHPSLLRPAFSGFEVVLGTVNRRPDKYLPLPGGGGSMGRWVMSSASVRSRRGT